MANRKLVLNREAIRNLSVSEKHMNAGHSLWTCDLERTFHPNNEVNGVPNIGANGRAR